MTEIKADYQVTPANPDYQLLRSMLNTKLDEARPVAQALKRAKTALEALPDFGKRLRDLDGQRAVIIANSYLSDQEPDTTTIDCAIDIARSEQAVGDEKQKKLKSIVHELSDQVVPMDSECNDLISRMLPNVRYYFGDEIPI